MSFRRTKKRSSKRSSKRSRRGSVKKMRMRPLGRTRPNSIKRNIAAFGRNCPRRPRLCKKQCRRSRTSPTGLANRSNWPKWPKPTLAKSGTTNFSSPLNHCTRRGPKQGKTL